MDFPPSIPRFSTRTPIATVLITVGLVVTSACGSPDDASRAAETDNAASVASSSSKVAIDVSTTVAPTTTTTATPPSSIDPTTSTTNSELEPEQGEPVLAFNGRAIPETVSNPSEAAARFVEIQDVLRVDGEPPEFYADAGHTEQLIIRTLMRNPEWIDDFRSELPADVATIADFHILARSELGKLHAGWTPGETIPAWEIIEPASLDELIGYYKSASAETGIDWQILAGINLIETGMGRIDGLSSAGAQGPMQFLPTTWVEVSEGGNIDDPEDAIHGAARYVVRRGGLDDIRAGLWGYNNSDHYVNAVLAYADLIKHDERQLRGFYNWEIYVGSTEGTLWLPVGYRSTEPASASEYLLENPWAKTLE